MDLLLLAADIQKEILLIEVAPGAQPISERALRDGALKSLDWLEQGRRWAQLVGNCARPPPTTNAGSAR